MIYKSHFVLERCKKKHLIIKENPLKEKRYLSYMQPAKIEDELKDSEHLKFL